MLPSGRRLRASGEFQRTFRLGVRAARPTLVVHALGTDSASRAGFVVSKAVGNAVIRNRVKRRLRHLAMPALAEHPVGVDFVVRAFPAATNGDLAQDFKSALASCYRKLGQS